MKVMTLKFVSVRKFTIFYNIEMYRYKIPVILNNTTTTNQKKGEKEQLIQTFPLKVLKHFRLYFYKSRIKVVVTEMLSRNIAILIGKLMEQIANDVTIYVQY